MHSYLSLGLLKVYFSKERFTLEFTPKKELTETEFQFLTEEGLRNVHSVT